MVLDGLRFSGGSRGIRLNEVSDFTIANCEGFKSVDVEAGEGEGEGEG